MTTAALRPYPSYKPSGVPWLGDVPEHWGEERLDRLFALRQEAPLPDDQRVTGYLDGRVTLRSNVPGQKIKGVIKEAGWQRVHPGDFAISGMNAHLGGMGVSDSLGKCSPIYLVLTPKPGTNAFLVSHAVRHAAHAGALKAYVNTIRFNSADFKRDSLKLIRVQVPSVEEQSAIVRYLDHVDRRIRKYIRAKQKLIALLNEQKQAIIHQAVTGQIDVRTGKPYPKYKPSGVPWLGAVPEHWETSKLSRLVRSSNAGEVIDKGWWGRGDETLFTCARDPLRSDYKQFPPHKRTTGRDLLVTRNGTPYVHRPPRDAIYSNVVQRINLVGGCNREFVALALEQATRAMRGYGVSIESLNYDMWKVLVVLNPPADEQTAIVNHSEDVSVLHVRAIEAVGREVDALREYRTRLVADVVTGKLDVREAAANLPEEAEEHEGPGTEAPEELEEANEEALGSEDAEGQA
jgi:type I restriction enzyme S subunit